MKRLLAVFLVATSGLIAQPARAISIDALLFDGPGGFGFSAAAVAGSPVAAVADAGDSWVLAGGRSRLSGPGLVVEPQILQAILSNPQASGRKPTLADPVVVDSKWTVTNETGKAIGEGFLVFTRIDTDGRYPGLAAGLDGALLDILQYSAGNTSYFFGAARLPSLGAGESVDLTVRYIVGGPLDYEAGSDAYLLPRLGIAGILVPEPLAASAIALGLGGLALARRRSLHSRRSAPR